MLCAIRPAAPPRLLPASRLGVADAAPPTNAHCYAVPSDNTGLRPCEPTLSWNPPTDACAAVAYHRTGRAAREFPGAIAAGQPTMCGARFCLALRGLPSYAAGMGFFAPHES